MTIKFGRSELKVSTPANLDDRLVDLCGCSAKEVRQMIDGPVTPVMLATAMFPFVESEIARHELGERLGKLDDLAPVRDDVMALYDKAAKGSADATKAKG